MRSLIAIALGLLLLVSAAAAQGNDNTAIVTVNENTTDMSITDGNLAQITAADADLIGNDNTATQDLSLINGVQIFGIGQSITGANFAQIEKANADLTGNGITATQDLSLTAGENHITGELDKNGLPDGKTNFIQEIDLDIKDTGNNNVDEQNLFGFAFVELLTIGNAVAIVTAEIDDSGNNNHVLQDPDIHAVYASSSDPIPFTLITRSDFIEAANLTARVRGNANDVTQALNQNEDEDHITDSKLIQEAALDAYVNGNTNDVLQEFEQSYAHNDLANSKLYEQLSINADILGNDNNLGIGSFQSANQIADSNDLTNSLARELICLDEQITGNSNDVSQIAEENTTANLMTASTEIQSITEKAKELGNGNLINQNATINNEGNSAVGGHIAQQTDIVTNV